MELKNDFGGDATRNPMATPSQDKAQKAEPAPAKETQTSTPESAGGDKPEVPW